MIITHVGIATMLVFSTATMTARAGTDVVFPRQALSDYELENLRGGFVLENFEIRIGLEQMVSVNGEPVALNRLTIPNLNQVVNGAVVSHTVEAIVGKLGDGQGGQALVSATSTDGGWITLIQNTLNDTAIQNSRQLNIELNNLGSVFNRLPGNMREPVLQLLGR